MLRRVLSFLAVCLAGAAVAAEPKTAPTPGVAPAAGTVAVKNAGTGAFSVTSAGVTEAAAEAAARKRVVVVPVQVTDRVPRMVFVIGVALVLVDMFFFPGTVVVALSGLGLMLASLIWSMADIWPNQPVVFDDRLLLRPLTDLGLGLLTSVVLVLLFAKFIPKGWFFSRLAVAAPIAGSAQLAGAAPEIGAAAAGLVGRRGVAATDLFPSGQVEIDGRRYEARTEVGTLAAGTRVVVRRKTDFGLIVDAERDAGGAA